MSDRPKEHESKSFIVLVLLLVMLAGGKAWAKKCVAMACSRTTTAAMIAERQESYADYWVTVGNCFNFSDWDDYWECSKEARAELRDALAEVRERYAARREVCKKLGKTLMTRR